MKKIFGAFLLGGIFLAALVMAEDETKPAPPHSMGRMMEMMGKGSAMGRMEHMGAMMGMMRGMGGEEAGKMMEHCQQMMDSAPATEPEKNR